MKEARPKGKHSGIVRFCPPIRSNKRFEIKRVLRPPSVFLSTGALACGILLIMLAGCGSQTVVQRPQNMMQEHMGPTTPVPQQATPGTTGRVFTLEELATYNGQNGQPAYIAVDGIVYDVTGQPDWPMGDHTPCGLDAMAGKDLSQVLNQAPADMRTHVQQLPVVGTLASQ